MNFYDKVHELVRDLKTTNEYKKYVELKQKVKQDSVLSDKIKIFREKQMAYQKEYLVGKEMDEATKQEMQQLYSLIIQSPVAAEFFQAEITLDVMLADMQKIIGEGIKDVLDF